MPTHTHTHTRAHIHIITIISSSLPSSSPSYHHHHLHHHHHIIIITILSSSSLSSSPSYHHHHLHHTTPPACHRYPEWGDQVFCESEHFLSGLIGQNLLFVQHVHLRVGGDLTSLVVTCCQLLCASQVMCTLCVLCHCFVSLLFYWHMNVRSCIRVAIHVPNVLISGCLFIPLG